MQTLTPMKIRLVHNQNPKADMPPGTIYVDTHTRRVSSYYASYLLPPRQFRVFLCLVMNLSKTVNVWDIFYTAWDIRTDPSGGPLNARQVVDNMIAKLRPLCDHFNVPIVNNRPHGWYIEADKDDTPIGPSAPKIFFDTNPVPKYNPEHQPLRIEDVLEEFDMG
jgi:hypothetical protein